jgi:hypothetical protein
MAHQMRLFLVCFIALRALKHHKEPATRQLMVGISLQSRRIWSRNPSVELGSVGPGLAGLLIHGRVDLVLRESSPLLSLLILTDNIILLPVPLRAGCSSKRLASSDCMYVLLLIDSWCLDWVTSALGYISQLCAGSVFIYYQYGPTGCALPQSIVILIHKICSY